MQTEKANTVIDLFEAPQVDVAANVNTVEGVSENDPVHKPQHYQGKGGLQAIDVIEAFELNYHLGNVVKYTLRCNNKHEKPLEDLNKATWYLMREIINQGYKKELKTFLEKYLKDLNNG